MNLATLSTDSLLTIFQKMEYNVLARFRMASKSTDSFIEKYRHSIRQYCSLLNLYIRFTSLEQPFDLETQTGYFYVMCGSKVVEIKDPYRELSPFLFRRLKIWRASDEIPPVLQSPTTVIPILGKLHPNLACIDTKNLLMIEILTLVEIVRSTGLIVRQPRPNEVDVEGIMQHTAITKRRQFVCFQNCWDEQGICSQDIISNFKTFRQIFLYEIHPLFIKSMIERLRFMDNLGNIDLIEMTVSVKFFGNENNDPPPNYLLWCATENTRSIYLIDGVRNWLIFLEKTVSRKINILLRVIKQDPLHLLRELTENSLGKGVDYSPICEEFVNASDMEERHKVFQKFYEDNHSSRHAS